MRHDRRLVEMLVAADEEIYLAQGSGLDELVVFGVTANLKCAGDLQNLSSAPQEVEQFDLDPDRY